MRGWLGLKFNSLDGRLRSNLVRGDHIDSVAQGFPSVGQMRADNLAIEWAVDQLVGVWQRLQNHLVKVVRSVGKEREAEFESHSEIALRIRLAHARQNFLQTFEELESNSIVGRGGNVVQSPPKLRI